MYEDLTPEEFVARRSDNELWQLLDVREPWELEIARVEGSLDIPMGEVPERLDELDRDRPIAVLCHGGVRSARVASYLAQQGLQQVANIAGGIDAWSRSVDETIPRY